MIPRFFYDHEPDEPLTRDQERALLAEAHWEDERAEASYQQFMAHMEERFDAEEPGR